MCYVLCRCYSAVRIMPQANGQRIYAWAHEDTRPKVGFIPWALNCHFHIHMIARILRIYVYRSTKGLFRYPKFRFEYFCPSHIHICPVHGKHQKLLQFFYVGRAGCVIHQNVMTQAKVVVIHLFQTRIHWVHFRRI